NLGRRCSIGGDGKGKYHNCDKSGEDVEVIDIADQEYYVVGKGYGTTEQEKYRGPFNESICFRIHGIETNFYFDQTSCNF
ncbi:1874_t:CDS:1, partial [Racocetra persica]